MGCWNNTCAITKLPITDGDEVIALLLVHNTTEIDRLGAPFSYGVPLPFYWEGSYNDYGAVEGEHGVMLEPIIETIKKHLVEFELGDNKYHDIEVKKESFDHHMLMEADHEDRLKLTEASMFSPNNKKEYSCTHIEIRKEAFDAIVEQYSYYSYGRDENDNFVRTTVTFADIVDQYRHFYNALMESVDRSSFRLGTVFDNRDCPVGGLLHYDYKKDMSIMQADEYLTKMAEDGATFEEMMPVIDNAVKLAVVSTFMSSAGQQWIVPGHIGQENDTDSMTTLANIVLKSAEVLRGKYDDEYEE